MSALAYVHKIQGLQNPTSNFVIHKLLHSIRRFRTLDKRRPFSIDHIRQLLLMLQLVTNDQYMLVLYRTMFLTAFFGLFRGVELTLTSKAPHNLVPYQSLSFIRTHGRIQEINIKLDHYKHSQGRQVQVPI